MDKYWKLFRQLSRFNLPKKVLDECSGDLAYNILYFGIFSVIYRIQHEKVAEYRSIYCAISADQSSNLDVRLRALFISFLLIVYKPIAKLAVFVLIRVLLRVSYKQMLQTVELTTINSARNIVTTY